jgi:hypothetical protein
MFLTCFSYFSCYFIILVFFHNRYLLILSHPFLAIRESNFVPFLVPLVLRGSTSYMHPKISCTAPRVSQSKMLSAFCRRFLVQTSIGRMQIIPFLLTKILGPTLPRVT